MAETTIYTDVDYERDGKQTGHLFLPYSPHTDAWGCVVIPICVIRNGEGPTVLMSGGVHGDEYEGPIAYGDLIRNLDPAELRGRLIIVPSLNSPAAFAGRRVSPLDGKNMNRTYPGDPFGSESQQISWYAENVLYPMADLVMDLHSGGSSLQILPSTIVEPTPDRAQESLNVEACRAFDAPWTVRLAVEGDPRTSTAAAVRQKRVVIGSELGGGGYLGTEGLAVAKRGIRRVLAWKGMLREAPPEAAEPARTRVLTVPGNAARVIARRPGIFEPAHPLGTMVEKGDVAGRIHSLEEPWREPDLVHYGVTGLVWCHRAIGKTDAGSCVAVIAAPWQP